MKARVSEKQWLGCSQPSPLLDYIKRRTTRRKMRLFACACARSVSRFLGDSDNDAHAAIDLSESVSDGLTAEMELKAIIATLSALMETEAYCELAELDRARDYAIMTATWAARGTPSKTSQFAAMAVVHTGLRNRMRKTRMAEGARELAVQAKFARDIFGNPFRPAKIDPDWLAWNRGTVVNLATTIYEDRRWELMPILGDALEDAMCDNADMLEHCRGPGPHVRGCWVVDLILGKS